MANECDTSIVFYSKNKRMVEDLWRNITDFCSDNHDCTIYKFMRKMGYSKNDLHIFDERGAITHCDSSVTYSDSIAYFKIETISAWMPRVDEFYKLIDNTTTEKSLSYLKQKNSAAVFTTTQILKEDFSRTDTK